MKTNNHRRREVIFLCCFLFCQDQDLFSAYGEMLPILTASSQSIKACHSSSFQAGFWINSSPAGHSGCTRAPQWFNHENVHFNGTWTTTDIIRLARMCKTWNCVFSVVSLSK
ncbi:hypothetical protein Peur_013192 [Populus x canadensis]